MRTKKSSRRECLQADATATGAEMRRTASGVQSLETNNNRSPQGAQRKPYSSAEQERRHREARYRIERQREQRQAARFFYQLQRGCVRHV